VGRCGGHGTLSNQLQALNLGQVCHITGKRVKNDSVILSCRDSLVLLVLHGGYAWATLLLARKFVVHYQSHHEEIGSMDTQTQTHTHARTHARTHAHTCTHAHTHTSTHAHTLYTHTMHLCSVATLLYTCYCMQYFSTKGLNNLCSVQRVT